MRLPAWARRWAGLGPREADGLPPLMTLDPHALSLIEGVRAGFAIAVVVALGQFAPGPHLLRVGLMQAALGAMLTCLCDAGGPLARRLPALLVFAALGALATAGFGLLRAEPAWAVPLAGMVVFAASLARVYGQSAMQVGNLLTVVLVLALRVPLTPPQALLVGATFLAGSLWALLLTVVLWRLQPHRPLRAAVADIYRGLARLCADMRRLLESQVAEAWTWDRHARFHRRMVRESIERARATILATARKGGAVNGRTARAWVRLETAEQLFSGLIALSELARGAQLDPTHHAAGLRIARMARLLEPILRLQGRAILAEHAAARPALDRAVAAVVAVARSSPAPPSPPAAQPGAGQPATGQPAASDPGAASNLTRIAAYLSDRLRFNRLMSDARATLPDRLALSPGRMWTLLRAALSFRSAALRHALRTSLAATAALALTMAWPLPYAHWFTITLVLTMQPYFALTFGKAVERIGGTVLGGVLAAALATLATTPIGMSLILFPLAMLALAVRAVSFGLFMAGLTPVVVLLSELGQPGSSEWVIALARAGFTLAGGLLALLLSWRLWPVWEPARVEEELATAIRLHGALAAAGVAHLAGDADAATVADARRAAGVASNALEASLQRALLEPGRGGAARLQAALTVDAALRRIAGLVTAMYVGRHARPPAESAAWRLWAAWLAAATGPAALSGGPRPPRPPLPEGGPDADLLTRIVGQIEVVAGALGWDGGGLTEPTVTAPPPARQDTRPSAPGAATG